MSQASEVPVVGLADGAAMPLIGLGTWKLSGDEAEATVTAALQVGYRHIDTAVMYGNEAEIGSALGASDTGRDEVFVTTKIRPSDLGREEEVLHRSLRALRTGYLDLWLIHWPPSARGQREEMWNALRELRDQDLTRSIGVSNFDLAQLDELAEASGEMPAVNQVRWSPSHFDAEFLAGHRERGVVLEGYSGLLDSRLGGPVVGEIAAAHGVSPARVVLRWHLEHGIPVIPKSRRRERLEENFDLLGFALTSQEMARLDGLASA